MSETKYIIGVCGGSGSGKTTFLKALALRFSNDELAFLSQDQYFKSKEEQPLDDHGIPNYDTPGSLDLERFISDIQKLKQGETVRLKEYTFNNPDLVPAMLEIKPCPILLVDGLFLLHDEYIRSQLDVKIFIETEDFLRLKRRIQRDQVERGYDVADVLYRTEHHVEPAYQRYIAPYKNLVDFMIPSHSENNRGLDVLESYLRSLL